MDEKHAILSASGSHKWLSCTPSARLEEQFENKTSEFMEEGTLAHAIAEFKAKSYFLEAGSKRKYNSAIKKFEEDPNFKKEMQDHTDTYIDYLKSITLANPNPFITIEKKLDYSTYAKDGFGTADCIIISQNILWVIDFKYGKGVCVSAENNPQMMLYALGAIEMYKFLYNIETVKMCIVQPRLDNISEFETTSEELFKWGEFVKIKAGQAFLGIGEFVPGEHCRFCRAKGNCKARADKNIKVLDTVKTNPALLTNEEIGNILLNTIDVEKWLKDMQQFAQDEILKGKDVQGWKLVEGKSNRIIDNLDGAFEILKNNEIDEVMLYEKKPLGITALESLVGKKKFKELLSDFIIKPKGSPTLVQENDKREKYIIGTTAKEDFAESID